MVDLENGYLKIANELMDAIIQHPFSKRQYKVLFAVIRKTYGYNKKSDDLSLDAIAKMAMLDRTHVSRTLVELDKMNVIKKSKGNYGFTLSINKNCEEWEDCQNGNKGLPKQQCQNGNIAKTAINHCQNGTIQKTSIQKTTTTNDIAKMAMEETFTIFWAAYPNKKSKAQAEKSWKKLKPNEQLMSQIMSALEVAKTSRQWTKDDGEFIPHPSTWLNQRRWEDEQDKPKRAKGVAL